MFTSVLIKRSSLAVTLLLAILAGMLFATFLQPSKFTTNAQAQGNCTSFPATGQQVCGRFLTYWLSRGGLPQFGYPISGEFSERSDLNGNAYTVQYFERAVFEYHPENKPPYDVLLSQLGTFRLHEKYPQGPPTPSVSSTPGTAPAVKGVEVTIGPDVVATLIDQIQASITGVETQNCGIEMTWVLRITNRGTAPFLLDVDKTSLKMVDSTGQSYPLSPACGGGPGQPYSGSFAQAVTLSPGDIGGGFIVFDAAGIPPTAKYLDLSVTLSGTPVVFRYTLPGK